LVLKVEDVGDLVSISCKTLRGHPKPLLEWKRSDNASINYKEQYLDEKKNTLVIDFDRFDVSAYDANFKCIASNKFQTFTSEIDGLGKYI
jgi:hypothetical protein